MNLKGNEARDRAGTEKWRGRGEWCQYSTQEILNCIQNPELALMLEQL